MRTGFSSNGFITLKATGDFKGPTKLLKKLQNIRVDSVLNKYGQKGVNALMEATPKDTGLTASSWSYEIQKDASGAKLLFKNSNVQGGKNVAVLIQYGHGTKSGGYVKGIDYINPVIKPLFEEMTAQILKEIDK